MLLYVIAQTVGILGMAGNIISYLQRSQRAIITVQLFASVFWTLHYILLGIAADTIYVACILNIFGILRAIIFANKKKFKADSKIWLVAFVTLYLSSYVLTFTVFGKEPILKNFIFELFPVIAMTANTIGFSLKTARGTRFSNFINSPCWLVYSIFSFSISGIIGEILTLTTTVIGLIRHDRHKRAKTDNN